VGGELEGGMRPAEVDRRAPEKGCSVGHEVRGKWREVIDGLGEICN